MGFIIAAIIVVGVVAIAGGGHTVHGFGKDLQHTGQKIDQ